MSKSVRESVVERDLCQAVAVRGGIAEKVTAIGRRGFFDRLVVMPGGRIIFVEVKRPKGGRLSPLQKARRDRYLAMGCEVAIIKNSDQIGPLLDRGGDLKAAQ